MQRIIYVTTLVVFTEYYGAAGTNVTEKIIDNSTSLAKHTMTKLNSIIENAPEHVIVKSLTNLMSKRVFHTKEQAKPIFRNENENNNDININIKVNYENINTSRSTKQEDEVNNFKNINRNGIGLDDSNNALEESYELLTGNLIKKNQCDYRNNVNCKASNSLAETVFVSQDNTLENQREQDDIESNVGNAETVYYADGEDSNDHPEIAYLVEYDEALMQTSKEPKTRLDIIDKKRANNNKIYVRMSRLKKYYKKPNLLLKNQIKIYNTSKANTPNKLIETKGYDKIVREVTRYPHVKNKRFKILSQPKIKKIIKVKKVANSANKKLTRTKTLKLVRIHTNNDSTYGVTSKYKYIASQSYPSKQLKQKYQQGKYDQFQDASKETQEPIHDGNKTRVRQKNNYEAAKKHKNPREDTRTFKIIPIHDKEISSISPKDNIRIPNNALDNKVLMDTLTKKLSQDVVINNITDYLLTKIVQTIALRNNLAKKNVTVDERIFIDLKGELTEVESESASWSEPSREVKVLGGAREKLNLRVRRLRVK